MKQMTMTGRLGAAMMAALWWSSLLLAQATPATDPSATTAADARAEEASPALPDAAPANPAAATDTPVMLENIIVVAPARAQALQDIPISITSVTAEALHSMGVASIEDLALTTPSLTISGRVGNFTPVIRGVGTSTNNGGTESAVAVYIDGAYIPSIAGMKFSFNNIERIDVLKGPQGTLYGRNATGGVLDIVTREPTAKPTLIAGLRFDDYQTAEQSVYGSIGLLQNLNGDLAVFHSDQSQGYGRNQTTGRETYDGDETGVRSSLLWTPAAQTRVRLSGDYINVDSTKGVQRQVQEGARTLVGGGALADFYDTNSDVDPFYRVEGGGLALRLDHAFADLQLLGVSAFRDGRSNIYIDPDASPIPIVDVDIREDNRSFSQTLQLQSQDTGPLSWVAGLSYFDYDVGYALLGTGIATTQNGGRQIVLGSMTLESYAAFAETTLALPADTRLTLGLRYTDEERRYVGGFSRPNLEDPAARYVPGTAPDRKSTQEPTWRVSLDHRFDPRVLGYVSYNRGFSSAMFAMVDPDAEPIPTEVIDAYELGIKSDLLQRRLQVNAAVFWYEYEDQQVRTFALGGLSRLGSVPESRLRGAEVELSWAASSQLQLNAGLTLLDTEYTDFPNGDISEPQPAPGGGNFYCASGQQVPSGSCPETVRPELAARTTEGNEMQRAPDYTATLAARYAWGIASGEMSLSASAAHNDGFYWAVDNRTRQDAYTLLNAQLDWTNTSRRYRVYVFGKNLSDEAYSQATTSDTFGDIVTAAPPRTFGLGTELRFE